jgi:hypothetical protein
MGRKEEFSVGELTECGIDQKVGTHTVTVKARNLLGYVTRCEGADVPHDGDAGFAPGCQFTLTSAGTIYLNAGSVTVANFDLLGTVVGAGSITAAELAADAVETAKIKAGQVTPVKMSVLSKVSEATDGNITVLVADLLKGYFVKTNLGQPGTLTFDTAANIQGSASFNATAGAWFDWLFVNSSGQTVTLTLGVGISLKGTAAVPNGKTAKVRFINTGAGTIDAVIFLSA